MASAAKLLTWQAAGMPPPGSQAGLVGFGLGISIESSFHILKYDAIRWYLRPNTSISGYLDPLGLIGIHPVLGSVGFMVRVKVMYTAQSLMTTSRVAGRAYSAKQEGIQLLTYLSEIRSVYTCIYMYTEISVYVYIYICNISHICISICIYTYIYIYIYIHIYMYVYVCVWLHVKQTDRTESFLKRMQRGCCFIGVEIAGMQVNKAVSMM